MWSTFLWSSWAVLFQIVVKLAIFCRTEENKKVDSIALQSQANIKTLGMQLLFIRINLSNMLYILYNLMKHFLSWMWMWKNLINQSAGPLHLLPPLGNRI